MLIDSKHQELSVEEILSIAAQESGGEFSPEQVKASVIAEVHQLGAFAIRQGNTLFIVHKDPDNPKCGVFRALNADTPQNYLANSMVFIKVAKTSFDVLVSQFKDASLLNIFKYISRNPPFPGMGYAVQKTKDGGYQVTVNLGSEVKGGLEAAR